jgi:hypothetical protein
MLHHHKRFLETGDARIIMCRFPVKIEAASAGWTRCVAMVEE